jgi:DNA-binding LytR/AlgR family response regulator
MNIAICDDIAAEAEEIRDYLLFYFKQNGFTGNLHIYNSGEALLADFSPGCFDVIFLDIYMHGLNGVETATRVRESDPDCLLVFVTSSDSHMRDGFALRAASYVEKPLTPEKLEVAFSQCRNLFLKNARFIEVVSNRHRIKIPFTRIVYAEGMERTMYYHLDSGKTIESRMKMEDAAEQLSGSPFLRCHRSFIVNMNYVEDVLAADLLMKNGKLVPFRKNGRSRIAGELNKFLTERLFTGV